MRDKEICQISQLFDRIVVVVRNRFIAAIAACHYDWHVADGLHEQMMERRVGKHDSQARVAWGYASRHLGCSPFQKYNRASG
jgi:hypothetical protein